VGPDLNGSFVPLLDKALGALDGLGAEPYVVLVVADATTRQRPTDVYWERHRGELPHGHVWTAEVSRNSVTWAMAIVHAETLPRLRSAVLSPMPKRAHRSYILATSSMEPRRLMVDLANAPGFGSRLFLARDYVPTIVGLGADKGHCVLRPWIDFDASVEIFGPSLMIKKLWGTGNLTE
jgi:hypothetical protein